MNLMTMNGAMHSFSDADRIYLPRKNNLAFVFKITTEKMLIAVRRSNMVNSEEATDKIAYKKDEFLYMYGQFVREIAEDIDKEKTWK